MTTGTTKLDSFGLPAGRYAATIQNVSLAQRSIGDDRLQWHLSVDAQVERNGKRVVESRPMARDGRDPYELTDTQRKGLRAMAKRLGVVETGPAEEVVAAVEALKGQLVTAHVRASKASLLVTLYRDAAPVSAAGETLDVLPAAEPDYRAITIDAQDAHEKLIMGLHHAGRGEALQAESCFRLAEHEGWKALGYDSLSAYLADPDVSLSRSQFYSRVDVWTQYVVKGGIAHERLLHLSKLEVPLPALKEGTVTAEEAVADAQALGLRDLRIKYRGESDPTGVEPKPEPGPAYPFACRECGARIDSEEDIAEIPGDRTEVAA